ncbi:MAG: nucleotidyltransferase family protein [Tissierellaceae bacterium]
MITGIIMASGFSNRMGKDKLLIDVNGKKIIERVIEAAKYSKLDEVILIYRTEEVRYIGETYKIKTIYNPSAHLGQSQSVIIGVESSEEGTYMFFIGDQPFISVGLIDLLIDKYNKESEKIIVPYYENMIGMPIIFPSSLREELLRIWGDKGGGEIIRNNPLLIKKVYIDDEYLIKDIDTVEDYERWCK